jgi:hypothetical protein
MTNVLFALHHVNLSPAFNLSQLLGFNKLSVQSAEMNKHYPCFRERLHYVCR